MLIANNILKRDHIGISINFQSILNSVRIEMSWKHWLEENHNLTWILKGQWDLRSSGKHILYVYLVL